MENKNMVQTKQDIFKLQIFSHSIHSLGKVHTHKVVSIFLFAHLQKALKKWCKLGNYIQKIVARFKASDNPKNKWWPLNIDSHEFDCLSSSILPKKKLLEVLQYHLLEYNRTQEFMWSWFVQKSHCVFLQSDGTKNLQWPLWPPQEACSQNTLATYFNFSH